VFAEEVAYFDDILVERAAPHVGMDAPDRVNQFLARDDDSRVLLQKGEDTEFLAADDFDRAIGELDLSRIGVTPAPQKINGSSVTLTFLVTLRSRFDSARRQDGADPAMSSG